MNSNRNSFKKKTSVVRKRVKNRRCANKVKKNILSQNVNNPDAPQPCFRKRLSTRTSDEADLDESRLLEERLRNLLTGNKRELRRPRDIFNNIQEDVPKLRRSVVARALQSVVSSTPMPTKSKVGFFPTELSLNISPIDTNSDKSEERVEIKTKENECPMKDVNLPPRQSLPIVILDSTDENDEEVQKCLESKAPRVYNTRSHSKMSDALANTTNSKRSKDYNENLAKMPNTSSDKENTSKSKGRKIVDVPQILEEKAKSSEKSKTNLKNKTKDVLSDRKRIDINSNVKSQNKTGSLLESSRKRHTKSDLNEPERGSHSTISCNRNARSHTSANSKLIEFDIESKTLQNENCDNQKESEKKANETLLSTNKSVKDLQIHIQTSPLEASLSIKNTTCDANTPNTKSQHSNVSSQRSLKHAKSPDKEKSDQSLQKISVEKNVSRIYNTVENVERESSRRLPARKLSFAEKGKKTQENIDANLQESKKAVAMPVKSSNIPILRSRSKSKEKPAERKQSKNEQTTTDPNTILNKPEEKSPVKITEADHCERSFKKNEVLTEPQRPSPPKRPPRRRKAKHRKGATSTSAVSETESDLPATRQHPSEGFAKTTDGIQNGVFETSKSIDRRTQIEDNVQNSRALEMPAKLDKSNATDFRKTVADIGTQISPLRKGASEKPSSASKTVKDKFFVEMGLSPIAIITGNRSFERPAEKTVVDTGTSPFAKSTNKTPAYSKPENLNRIISRISERTLNSPKTPFIASSGTINRVPQTEVQPSCNRNLQEKIHREVQTSVKKMPHKNPHRKKKLNQSFIEQETQTSHPADKLLKAKRKLRNDQSDNSSSDDPSALLREYDREVANRSNMLFQSLKKDDFINISFSSSDDEFLDKTITNNRPNMPWRLCDDAGVLPRRSSLKLNFLRSVYQIEMEKESQARPTAKLASDSDDETDIEPQKNKSPYLRKTNVFSKVQKYSRIRPKKKFSSPASIMPQSTDEDSASSNSVLSDLEVENQEGIGENNDKVIDADDGHVALPIANEANLEAVASEENCEKQAMQSPLKSPNTRCASEEKQSDLVVVLSNVIIKEKTNKKSAEAKEVLNASLHSASRSKANSINLLEHDDEILAVPLPANEDRTFIEEREAGEENPVENIPERENKDPIQNNISKVHEMEETGNASKETSSSVRKRKSETAQDLNGKNVLREVNCEVPSAQKNVRSSYRKSKPQRISPPSTSQSSIRMSNRSRGSRRLLQDVNDVIDQTIFSSLETDSHRELFDVSSQMQSIINDRRSTSKRISSKVDDAVFSKEPEEAVFKVPKPRKPRKKNAPKIEEINSFATSEASESGIRRSGRERKPVSGRTRFAGILETYSEKELMLYNSSTTGIPKNADRASTSSKPRTKRKTTEKTIKNSKIKKKAENESEPTNSTSNQPNTPKCRVQIHVQESFKTPSIVSAYVDMANNNNNPPMAGNKSDNMSGIHCLSPNSNSADDLIVSQEMTDNRSPAGGKYPDKDSGRSTMLKTTFDDSHLRPPKVLTGRINKTHKRKEDFSTKISRVLSRSVNQSKELEIFNSTEAPDSLILRNDEKTRKTMSEVEDGEFISVMENNETVSFKYVEKHQSFTMGSDGLMISNMLSIREDKGTMGYLKVPPGTQKPLRISTKHDLFYFVIEGEGFIQVKNKTSKIVKLSNFIVPWGTEYSINNLSKEMTLVLGFVKMKHTAIESNKS